MRIDPRNDVEHYPHIIGGVGTFPSDVQMFLRTSPWDRRCRIGLTPVATAADVDAAVTAAERAFPSWSKTPAPARGRIIRRFGQLVRERAGTIQMMMVQEAGKTKSEAMGEVTKGALIAEYFDGEGLRPTGDVIPSESGDVLLYTRRFPVGVVGLITPWNFPFAVACWKILAAIVSGCTAVFKPSQLTPRTSNYIVNLLIEAGLPPGVLNLVHGGKATGEALVDHQSVRAISFTGSNSAGAAIYQRAADRQLTRVLCELGGKNAVIVMDDADLDAAAVAIAQGMVPCAGQRCTATSRVVAHRRIKTALTERIITKVGLIKVGLWTEEATTMGPLSSEEHLERTLSVISASERELLFGRLCFGGMRITDGDLHYGNFMEPTVFVDASPDSILGQEELFAPVLAILEAEDFDDAMRIHNDVRFGHAGSIFTENRRLMRRFVEEAEVGMVHINAPTVGGEAQAPFGGIKGTGIGPREMGKDGMTIFTYEKTTEESVGGGQLVANK